MKRTNMVWPLAVILVVTLGVTASFAGNKVEKVRHSLKALDLANTPTIKELMAAGQLGGQLYPTKEVKKNKKGRRHNREFGRAIDKWNRHEYKTAVKLFREYVRKYSDSPWADEALLHVGCDARYNGRYDEAEANFLSIIDKNEKSAYEGARHLATKARTRLGVLKVLQNDFSEAKVHFRYIKQSGSTWRERTYASYWIQRISRYEGDRKAMLKCGVQALVAIMEKKGKKTAARQVAQVRPQSLNGHSLLNLKKIASGHGYALDARRLKADELKKVDLPAIVQINGKSSTATGHYWVLEKIEADDLALFDPQSGRRFTQTLIEFDAQWEGIILLKQKSKKKLPGTALSEADMADLFGGCCGARRGEGGLGGLGGNGAGGGGTCNGSSCCGAGGGGSSGGSGGGPFGNPVWKVNMINMNLYVHDVPMWYRPPIGPEVRVGLNYNSLATTAYHEPFGNKWQFNYSTYLVVDTGGNVTVFMPDGRRDIYVPDSNGGYTQPYGVRNKLTKIEENHFELRFPDDTVFIYNIPAGTSSLQPFLVEIRDVHNLSLTFGYNANAELTTITDVQGRVTQLTYTTQGLVSQVADPFGRTALFEYDAECNLTRITDMGGYWFNFSYDQDVYLTGIENQKGLTQFWVEPADGVVANSDNYPPPGDDMWENYRITVTYPEGEKEEYMYYGGCDAYNGFGCSGYSWHVKPNRYIPWQSQQINNYRTNTPKTYYLPITTDNGQRDEVYKVINPDGTCIQYGIDTATGDRITISDSSGLTASITFNEMGKVVSITDVKGNIKTMTYAENGVDMISIQDGLGTVAFTYNDRHQITSFTDRLNKTYSFSYNNLGLLTSKTNPIGAAENYTYDADYRLREVQKDGKTIFSCLRDDIGRVLTKTDATGLTLEYTYSTLNQRKSITYPDGKTVNYQLCSCCPWIVEEVTYRSGRSTRYEYDSLNTRTAEIRPDGSVIRYTYDANRNLIKIKSRGKNKFHKSSIDRGRFQRIVPSG